ncbi:YybH family protein [Streptomyces sp. NPDC007983]|uniref:YybH family protein n=1 Tax=Streptomyces sp. NPDC007983 TaxID=3364800 RepID=UPI0036EE12C6
MLCDAVGPFVRPGEDPAGRLERWIASYRMGIGHEIRDPEISTGADLAFRHFPVRISGTMRDGTEVGIWVRATSCLRRQGGTWTIVHEHASVPFDADTGHGVLRGELRWPSGTGSRKSWTNWSPVGPRPACRSPSTTGHRVVNAVAGVADGTAGRPVTPETLKHDYRKLKHGCGSPARTPAFPPQTKALSRNVHSNAGQPEPVGR